MKIVNLFTLVSVITASPNPLHVGVSLGVGVGVGVGTRSAPNRLGFNQGEMLFLLNAIRVEQGVRPLVIDAKLTTAAQKHSNDQARMQQMSHTGSDGSTPSQRVSREGFDWSAVAENVAWNQRTEEDVNEDWRNSPGHYRTMINPEYTKVGFGMKDWYWTQVFAA